VTRTAWIVVGSVIAVGGMTPVHRAMCLLKPADVFVPFTTAEASPAVAQTAGGRPFEEVARDITSPDAKVRVNAMRTLNKAGHPDAIKYIAQLLTDHSDDIQLEALDTILGFYLPDVPQKSKRVAGFIEVEGGSRGARAFEQGPFILLPRPSPPELKKGLAGAMRDDNPDIRLEATYALGAIVPPPVGADVEAALAENMRDRDPNIRIAAVRVAGAVRVTTITDALVAAINDPEEKVKLAALRAVGDIRDPRGVKALEEQFIFYKKGPLARAAFDGVARIGSPMSLSLFQEHVTDRDAVIRRLAIEGVVRTHDQAAINALEISTAGENDNSAQLARAFALEASNKRGLDLLVSKLSDDILFEQAMGYLVELGPRVVNPLGVHLKDPNARVRERIAQTMGLIGDSIAAPALESTLRDPDVNVARAAERALARIRIISATREQKAG
jgi:HEAT repeat protein